MLSRYAAIAAAGVALASVVAVSCTGDSSGGGTTGVGVGGGADAGVGGSHSTGGVADGGSGGDLFTPNGSGGAGSGGEEPCAQTTSTADLENKPVDIIFLVGNNGSMTQEIEAVEQNINVNFAQIMDQSAVDYRVIMLSRSGAHQFNICVEAPLGGTAVGECSTLSNNAQPQNNPTTFYHYSVEVKQNDSWCKLLESFDGTLEDEYDQATSGWSEWLREEAAKVFVILSDSAINCTYSSVDLDDGPSSPNLSNIPDGEQAAADFDAFILAKSPVHFGTSADRNYIWYSVVGLAAKDPSTPTEAWLPSDDITIEKCDSEGTSPVAPALGYQALSVLTGGLRFPICEWQNFDTVFNQLAQGVITGAAVACEFPLPEPPRGEVLDLETVEVAFTPGGSSVEQLFSQVPDLASCTADSFYIEADMIKLCPELCAIVQADATAQLEVRFGCSLTGPG